MKKALLFSAFSLSMILFGCGSSADQKHEEMPAADTSHGVSASAHDSLGGDIAYICPCGGCPQVKEAKPGKCPKCEMDLVAEKK